MAEERHADMFHAAVAALSVERSARGTRWRSKIESRDVVHVCIEYADAIERTPTISEMCLVAHVSERRLRTAFTDILGVPPLRYFRYRALTNARRGLLNDGTPGHNVGTVASDQGFHNFGRFARHYEATFGELPSATRRMALRGTKRQGVLRNT
jgi:AraC family ethanolamine operon transcriptional activator